MLIIIDWLLACGILLLGGITIFLLSQKGSGHAKWLLINCMCGCFCGYLYWIQIHTTDLKSLISVYNACYIMKSYALIGFVFFTVDYCKIKAPVFFHRAIMLYEIMLTVMFATNGSDGLVYKATGLEKYHGISYLQMEKHSFYSIIIYSLCGLILCACVMFFMNGRKQTTRIGMRRTLLLGTTIMFPTIGVFLKKCLVDDKIDFIIILFLLSAIHIIILIKKYGLLDTIDIAKEIIVDSTDEGLLVVDLDLNVLFSNEVADELMKKEMTLVSDIFKNKVTQKEIENNHYEIRISELKEGKRLRGYMAWIFDITNSYEHQIEMEKLKEEAEKANQAKTNFLANMSHEIRTPMNAILGFSDLMLTEKNKSVLEEYAYDIKRSAQSLLHIINEVLDISKIEAGKLELIEENYYVQSLLQDECILMGNLARKKNLDFITRIDNEIPYRLYGASEEIKQIITNILNNAIKYTNSGSVTLMVEAKNKTDTSVDLCISAIDTGIGMKPEDVEKVFEKFSKFDTKVNREVEGTGLGMSIVKALVEEMGGKVEVESKYKKGTTIRVSIPQKIVDSRPIGIMQISSKDMEEEKKRHFIVKAKILMVDDNETNLKVGQAILKRYGINAKLAGSGREALELCKKEEYDLIFMDHMMPEMDGIETMHELRRISDYYLKCPVIALTANAISGVKEQMLQAGFEGYLAKPIEQEKLEDVLLDFIAEDKIHFVDEENIESNDSNLVSKLKKGLVDIDVDTGIKNCGQSIDDYIQILQVVLKYGEQRSGELERMIKEKDYDNYTINVHALKSTAANIGAKELSEASLKQEMRGREKHYAELEDNADNLIDLYKNILQQIELCVGNKKEEIIEANKDKISNEELNDILEGVRAQLRDFSIDEAREIINEVLGFDLDSETRQKLEGVKECLDNLNVDEALRELGLI